MIGRLLSADLIVSLSGCGAAKDNYSGAYVGEDGTSLVQLQMVETDGGQISGTVSASQLDYSAGKVKLTTRPISGVRHDEQFSFVFHKRDWTESDAAFQAQAKGNSLVLMVPANGQSFEMHPMGQDEYRQRLEKFAQALNAGDVGLVGNE